MHNLFNGKYAKAFGYSSNKVLDVQFGVSSTSLKMVNACTDGHVKVYEFLDSLELLSWLCMGIGVIRSSPLAWPPSNTIPQATCHYLNSSFDVKKK